MYSPTITVHAARPGVITDIFIQQGIFKSLSGLFGRVPIPPKCFLVTDSTVDSLYGHLVRKTISGLGRQLDQFVCNPGETSKSWEIAGRIHAALASIAFPRDGLMLALGGGVVGDLGGFVAATWMRGVRWVNCPTTMEAVLDSCVGGKTAVNLGQGKNLVGAFHSPLAVVIDPDVLSTLQERDIRAGLAEAIKHAALEGEAQLGWLETKAKAVLSLDPIATTELIERNLRFKAAIVQEDPEERTGRRIILNFGHTVGHALESLTVPHLRHGECVALGMIAESRIAERLGLLGSTEVNRLRDVIARFGLPITLETCVKPELVWETMRVDKKNTSIAQRMVLLKGFGQPVVWEGVSQELVCDAVASLT